MRARLAVLVLACCCSTVWTQSPGWDVAQLKLTADDGSASDYHGKCVAVSSDGTTLVVGANSADGVISQPQAGSVYVYRLLAPSNETWTQVAELTADDAKRQDSFGFSVAISSDGTTVVVGAVGEDGGPGDPLVQAGAAYVFSELTPGIETWTQVAKLTADDLQSLDAFGRSVAISSDGTVVVVGANTEDGGPGDPLGNSGAVYVFSLLASGSGTWTQVSKLAANDASFGSRLGCAVAISSDGTTIVAGANLKAKVDGGYPFFSAGAAYVYRSPTPDSSSWTQVAKLTADDAQTNDEFGFSIAVSGDGTTIVAGSYYEDGGLGDPLSNVGAAYVFRETTPGSGTWTQEIKLTADDAQAEDYFGYSVAVSGDGSTVVVGATGEDGGAGDSLTGAGAAYVYLLLTPGNGTWTQVAKLTADDADEDDFFGGSTAISSDGTIVVVGAQFARGGAGDAVLGAGAAYLFSGDACPPGQTSDTSDMCVTCSVGSSVLGKPCSCDDGHYIHGAQCAVCPPYASQSILWADSPADCLCDRGYYNDGTICTACPANTWIFGSPVGADDLSDCVLCPPGHRPNVDDCEAVHCDRGEHFNSNQLECERCPGLTTSEAGVNKECHPDGGAIAAVVVPSSLAVTGAVAFAFYKLRSSDKQAPRLGKH